jgi:hypothetical protein
MNWMFWKSEGQTKKLPGPKEIPEPVGSYLVTKENMNPDLVWKLKAVILSRADEKHVFDVRVYDSNKTGSNAVKVINYHSLDDHPALVIFDGWYNKETKAVRKRDL